MNAAREQSRLVYIQEHTPPGDRPNFRLLAWHMDRRNCSIAEGVLMRTWHRFQKRRRMEKA